MKFLHDFYKTPLFVAIEKENIGIVSLLLSNDKIDINIPNIFINYYVYMIRNWKFL